ncbi:hypothetical protein GCM10023193_32910 [Planotetraspora kaengkrachanensis]|uniref:Uncharacterized protein n=1 Tax=Planotetraspora kaengkrachanensis TaxID=575193 RepID=A0A8J3V7V5_9ACTN|nr:hypothetical protein Pka01_49330 [Planotetraspora kaengkrachanensis]
MDRATVSPPTPLSKIPIAPLLSGTLPKVRGSCTATHGKNPHNPRSLGVIMQRFGGATADLRLPRP